MTFFSITKFAARNATTVLSNSVRHEMFNVESVSNVLARAYNVVEKLDSEPALASDTKPWCPSNGLHAHVLWTHHICTLRRLVVIVAHGDVLQILQTRFAQVEARLHRSLEHLPTAHLREL